MKTFNRILQLMKYACQLGLCTLVAALIATPLVASAGTWTRLTNQPTFLNPESACKAHANDTCAAPGKPSFGFIANFTLLTDGAVMIEGYKVADTNQPCTNSFNNCFISFVQYKLTPDAKGNYINGTWKQVASLPNAATSDNPEGYGPYGIASAVLPDGRVIYMGGENNGPNFVHMMMSIGAIYDPVADTWTPVGTPPFFTNDTTVEQYNAWLFGIHPYNPQPIGDAPSIVLADGTFMVANTFSNRAALLNPKTLTWTPAGTSGKTTFNNEKTWTLLPNGKVLEVESYVGGYDQNGVGQLYRGALFVSIDPNSQLATLPWPSDPTASSQYDPSTQTWSSAGSTIVSLTNFANEETGPHILMADGRVWGSGTFGTTFYDTNTGIWSAGPPLPMLDEVKGYLISTVDQGIALLPNGNVFLSTQYQSPNFYSGKPPEHFFEFDGNNFIRQPDSPTSQYFAFGFMVLLPTGQVLFTDSYTTDLEIYTPNQNYEHYPSYAPVILSSPTTVVRGGSYNLKGKYLNGVSVGAVFGDECNAATNYPLLRITNLASGHVFYSRTHDFSSMAVASKNSVTMKFDVPKNQELGKSKLEVVTNGIASKPLFINVSR